MGNLKTIIYSAVITSMLWIGDQPAIGVAEGEKRLVKATAKAYEDYMRPVAKIPEQAHEIKYSKIFKSKTRCATSPFRVEFVAGARVRENVNFRGPENKKCFRG